MPISLRKIIIKGFLIRARESTVDKWLTYLQISKERKMSSGG